MRANEITGIPDRPISRESPARDVARPAYVAKDGTPRNIPTAFTWNGSEIVMCATKNAPRLPALRENPMVALTIDTEARPPKILLIRGRAGPVGDPADGRGRTAPAGRVSCSR
ncbi:hypothetical protein ACFQ08_16440 [Streptosporangium algeriense]|uniref:Pyridoxamine 5'-phosphate oxidase putative domain-containing protein n=1 Tax=Streptosporangium algeriense TaxID=1682748 RepID=A0ABW3DT24_9ACTN